MATTLRLSSNVFLSALDLNARHLVNQFEHELIGLLGQNQVSRSDVLGRLGGPSWAGPGTAQILVSTSPQLQWEHRAHLMSRVDGSVTIPIIIEHPVVRFGPVADGVGACSQCLETRTNQHGLGDDFDRMRREAFSGSAGGPHLLLPHEVEYLIARAIAALEELVGTEPPPRSGSGRVTWFDLMSTSAATSEITGVHGCPTCGGQAGTPKDRTWKFLARREA